MKIDIKLLNAEIQQNPFDSFMHFQVIEAEDDKLVLTFHNKGVTWNNPNQTMYGGVLYAMADSAMALACKACGKVVVTLDLAMNYLSPALQDTIIYAHVHLIHQGRTTVVGLCDFYDNNKRYLAHGRGTFFVMSTTSNG